MNFALAVRRITAYLIDIILLFVVLAPAATLVEWLLNLSPQTPRQVWIATVLSFSIPTWLYFLLSDHSTSGATLGKRLLQIRVTMTNGNRPSLKRSFARTAIKLLPWEMVHVFGFALADELNVAMQSAGLIAANILLFFYLAITFASRGRRSLHDLLVGTQVRLR